MDRYFSEVAAWWQALGPAGPYYAWLATGVVGVLAWAVVSYWLVRRLAGHRKFRGTWYNEGQFAELVQMLHEDQQRGNRVMRHDEIELLRRWQFGAGKGLGFDRSNSYFS